MFTGIWTSHRSNSASIWCAAILPPFVYGGLSATATVCMSFISVVQVLLNSYVINLISQLNSQQLYCNAHNLVLFIVHSQLEFRT